jgi:hypothetical protein
MGMIHLIRLDNPQYYLRKFCDARGGAAVLTVTWMALGTLRELRHWAEPSYWRLRVPGTPGATYF